MKSAYWPRGFAWPSGLRLDVECYRRPEHVDNSKARLGLAMQAFAAVVISAGLTVALSWLSMSGIWWQVVRWAFYLPILMVGARYGSSAGLFSGVTASLLCAVVAASRGMGNVTWPGILAPDFAIVGLLGGFIKTWPRFRQLHAAGETDPWPALSRVSEPEIAFDPNPLTSIESAARLLGESDTPAELREELVDIVLKECKHLSASITSLLQQRRETTAPQVCESEITPILDAAVREAEFVLSGRGIVLRKEIAPDVPPIQCNPDQIRNLFMSLIINAAQSASAGTAVVLDAHCGYNGIVLDVKGQGPFVRRIANRFFGSRPGISGVSLAAAQDIVRRHGGKIGGKANLGKGLEFSVWLPLRRNDPNGGWQGVNSRR